MLLAPSNSLLALILPHFFFDLVFGSARFGLSESMCLVVFSLELSWDVNKILLVLLWLLLLDHFFDEFDGCTDSNNTTEVCRERMSLAQHTQEAAKQQLLQSPSFRN